jgi:hypothetical protein
MYTLWHITPEKLIQEFYNLPVEFAGRVPDTASTAISLTDEHIHLCRKRFFSSIMQFCPFGPSANDVNRISITSSSLCGYYH